MNPLRIEKPTSEAAHSGKSKPRLQVTPPQQAAQQSQQIDQQAGNQSAQSAQDAQQQQDAQSADPAQGSSE